MLYCRRITFILLLQTPPKVDLKRATVLYQIKSKLQLDDKVIPSISEKLGKNLILDSLGYYDIKQVITDIAHGEADLDTLKAGASLIPVVKITKVPKVVKAIGNVGKTGFKKGKEGEKTVWKRFTQKDQPKPDKNKGNQSKTSSKSGTTTSKPNQEEASKSGQAKQTKAKNKGDGGSKLKTVNRAGRYSETEIKNIVNNLKGDGFKNNPLRHSYENEVTGLKTYGEKLLARGMAEKKVAQTLNQARRDLGIKYKDATPQPLRDYIYEINLSRYGDKLGPTYEDLIKNGKSNMDIINSSSRPNSNIDKLLSGFEEWLRRQ